MLLRLSHAVDGLRHWVKAELEEPERARQTVAAEFTFNEHPRDGEDIRWYLEDYLEFPADPAPVIASRVEGRLAAIGVELFEEVFGSRDGQRLWNRAQERLEHVRVEVETDPSGVGLPWELLRDPVTDVPVALRAKSFVRAHLQPAQPLRLPIPTDGTLRVLLVICRPAGSEDVPFRSVASQLVRCDAQRQMKGLDLDVLRPPTFAHLTKVLRDAAQAGHPYQVVHFDGHGAYLELTSDGENLATAYPAATDPARQGDDGRGSSSDGSQVQVSPHMYATVSRPRPGRHGYLLFERPDVDSNQELVDGPTLGALLAEAGVPVLVLNACRSAYNQPSTRAIDDPAYTVADRSTAAGGVDAATGADVHARVRAYGSLAAEVADAGVPGVVAMRYNVYVVTAAQFVAELYVGLLRGRPLGEAVNDARRQLAADPQRRIGNLPPVGLQDWPVPVVFETEPLTLFIPPISAAVADVDRNSALIIDLTPPEQSAEETGKEVKSATALPRRPDAGFYGRDATLLALDRAFDTQRVLLLHALAGAGKTSTASEFARWYTETGGLDTATGAAGRVLFTSFEHHRTLPQLLAQFGDTFAALLAAKEITWQTLTVGQQRDLAVEIAEQVSVLWIWDNVEPVTGFPAGEPTPWTVAEQTELSDFLRDLNQTRARVLLTSRRDEQAWLGDLPVRVLLPAMPMRERFALAQALAARQPDPTGRPRILNFDHWRPVLQFSGGNPLTLTVLVRQAIRRHLTTSGQLQDFVTRLSHGRGAPEAAEDRAMGRSASLAASLDYGFAQAFTGHERAQLAVLHLFRGTVNADALVDMGATDNPNKVPELAGLSRDRALSLLDRAAEIGLLTVLGGGCYTIQPALPWYFTTLFTHAYGPAESPDALLVTHAYTTTYAEIGSHYFQQYEAGHQQAIDALTVEEDNLLHALHLARIEQNWSAATGAAQGLRQLYRHQGRAAEWAGLVDQLTIDLIDPTTDRPRPGAEDTYSLITDYRVGIAIAARDWETSTRLQQQMIMWSRARAVTALATPPEQLDTFGVHLISDLAGKLQTLADILRFQDDSDCLPYYQQAIDLYHRINSRKEGAAQFNLGNAYLTVPQLKDLDRAEQAYEADLRLLPKHDTLGRARTVLQLAWVHLERFYQAKDLGANQAVLLQHLNHALDGAKHALRLLPNGHPDRGIVHYQVGIMCGEAGEADRARTYHQQAIRYFEQAGNTYAAGQARRRLAFTLGIAGRHREAMDWAQAAIQDFQKVGVGATEDISQTGQLIRATQQAIDDDLSGR